MVIVGYDLGFRAMQGFQKGNRKTTDWKAESTATSGCRKDGQTIGFVMKNVAKWSALCAFKQHPHTHYKIATQASWRIHAFRLKA
jgi:hypothetical protein